MIELIYTIIFPLGLQLIIDKAIKNNDLDLLIYVAGGLGIVFVINTIMVICECYVVSLLNAKALDVVRSQMIYQMYSFPVSYYQKNQSTSILAYFSNDISAIENVIIRTLVKVLFFSASIICCTIILFFVEWRLALSVLCLTPLLIIIPDKISNKATDVSYTYKSTEAELLNNIQEHIFGQKIIGILHYSINTFIKIH
jgi:ABC-type multidrug transport system fused ATPase/permease subunit